MADQHTVDRAEMKKAAAQIDNASNQIHSTQQTLGGEISSLMNRWKGNAANAFLSAYTDFDAQFGKVQNELSKIHVQLVESQSTYVNTEDETTNFSNEINNLINDGPRV